MTKLEDSDSNRRRATMCEELRSLAVDPPDDGFSVALHRRLLAEPAPAPVGVGARFFEWLRGRRAWLWPASGLVSGLAVYGLLAVLHGPPGAGSHVGPKAAVSTGAGTVLPSFSIPSSKVAVIKLSFNAEVAVEDVIFQVTLPEGLYFWSGGERLAERSFRWPGRLDAGNNVVPIAVRSDVAGRYPVVASVEIEGRVLEQRIIMDVHKDRS
jgi:hypothetical protein